MLVYIIMPLKLTSTQVAKIKDYRIISICLFLEEETLYRLAFEFRIHRFLFEMDGRIPMPKEDV